MKELTKRQKLFACKWALEAIVVKDKYNSAICTLIQQCILTNYSINVFAIDIPSMFPELLKYKPRGKAVQGYWWTLTPRGKAARKRVLKALIEELS